MDLDRYYQWQRADEAISEAVRPTKSGDHAEFKVDITCQKPRLD